MATEEVKVATRVRNSSEDARAVNRARMASEEAKAATRARMATEENKTATRVRNSSGDTRAANRGTNVTQDARAADRARKNTEEVREFLTYHLAIRDKLLTYQEASQKYIVDYIHRGGNLFQEMICMAWIITENQWLNYQELNQKASELIHTGM